MRICERSDKLFAFLGIEDPHSSHKGLKADARGTVDAKKSAYNLIFGHYRVDFVVSHSFRKREMILSPTLGLTKEKTLARLPTVRRAECGDIHGRGSSDLRKLFNQ